MLLCLIFQVVAVSAGGIQSLWLVFLWYSDLWLDR
ncbi:hypothetical protein U370_01740 [Anaplasma marginale str. Dawn]|nr:hypothetical protein U370_01740 [Anaplasma marginale str. Dawn]